MGIQLVWNERNHPVKSNGEDIMQNEIEIVGDFQSFVNPGDWEALCLQIRTQTPPMSNQELCRMEYAGFEEQKKLVLVYQTYYPAIRTSHQHIALCPTCRYNVLGNHSSQRIVRPLSNSKNNIGRSQNRWHYAAMRTVFHYPIRMQTW